MNRAPTACNFATLALLLGSSLAGCTSVATVDGRALRLGSDAFAGYVESVFREQNALLSEISFSFDRVDDDSPAFRRLEAAEAALIDSCEDLNLLATRQQSGRPLRGLRAARAARTAPGCEQATLDAARVLEATSVDGARQ